MGILRVNPNADRGMRRDFQNGRQYLRTWNVVTDDANESLHDILNAAKGEHRIPQLGELDPDDPGQSRVLFVDAVPKEGDATMWDVFVSYSQTAPVVADDNPLARPPSVRWFTRKVTEPLRMSVAAPNRPSVPVVNSAGEFFRDPPQTRRSYPAMRYVRNEPHPFDILRLAWTDTVNSDNYGIFDIGQSYMADVTAEGPLVYNNVVYARVSYEVWFNLTEEFGWEFVKPMDVGFNRLFLNEQQTWELVPITDDGAKVFATEQRLDGNGRPQTILNPQGIRNKPVYLEFKAYKTAAWADLNIVLP